MAPTVIPDHNWVPLNTPDPLNKQIISVLSNSRLVIVQEIIHTVLSYLTAMIYVYYTYEIKEVTSNYAQPYQQFLFVVHIYFALDYIIRVLRRKNYVKFLRSGDSIYEILTTVPFLICLVLGLDIESLWYRICMMNDLARLSLARRLLDLWDDEMWPGILKILNNMVFFVMWSSACI